MNWPRFGCWSSGWKGRDDDTDAGEDIFAVGCVALGLDDFALAVGIGAGGVRGDGGVAVLHGRSASWRYVAGCAGLAVMAVVPVATMRALAPAGVAADGPARAVAVQTVERAASLPEGAGVGEPVAVTALPAVPLPAAPPAAAAAWGERVRSVLELRLAWVVAVWLLGVVILSLRLCGQWLWAQRAKSHGVRPVGNSWQGRLCDLAGRIGLRRPVRLVESAVAQVPLVIGHLRPVILLPAWRLTGLTPGQLEAILIHELAHIRRYDYFVNLVQTVIEILLFYHPAVWYVSRRIRAERENCCDDLAVAVTGDRLAYVRALVAMEELRQASPPLALAVGGSGLLQRIRRLVDRPDPRVRLSRPWGVGLFLIALIVVIFSLSISIAKDTTEPASAGTQPVKLQEQSSMPASAKGPFIVTGTVTDGQNHPLAGVRVWVSCGKGTLIPCGETFTGSDGRYALHFNGAMQKWDKATRSWKVPLQAAVVSPEMAGYYEKNLHRQGDLCVSDKPLKNANAWSRPENTLLPNKPLAVDFVLLPRPNSGTGDRRRAGPSVTAPCG